MQPVSSSIHPHLAEAFIERARAVAAMVSTVAAIEEAAGVIASADLPTTTGLYTTTSALMAAYPTLRDALAAKGIMLRTAEEVAAEQAGPSDVAAALAGDTAVVLAAAGMAETGSFLSAEETLPARLLGMLADSVFAILPAGEIVPGLDEIGALLSQLSAGGHRYLSLITGASRTSDIERVLTIGVQGPKALHIVIVKPEK